VPCELRRTFDGEWVGSPCIHLEDPARCDGCNGDGNRWVTVGALADKAGKVVVATEFILVNRAREEM